jgi:hypothetical protein
MTRFAEIFAATGDMKIKSQSEDWREMLVAGSGIEPLVPRPRDYEPDIKKPVRRLA